MKDDILHDLYLKMLCVNEKTVQRFHEIGKMHCLGLLTIRALYRERKRNKLHNDGATSTLYECCRYETDEFANFDYAPDSETIESKERHERILELVKIEIYEGLQKEDHDTQVFVMSQIEPMYLMAERTKINRYSLQKSYNKIKNKLKNIT